MKFKAIRTIRELCFKEMKLSAHCLSFIFILFGLMFFVPSYPVLCGAFFVSLGIFQSFQKARERITISCFLYFFRFQKARL